MIYPMKIFAILSILLGSILFLTSCSTPEYDTHYHLDPNYVLNAAGFDNQTYIDSLRVELQNTTDPWALGDTYLVLARLENNNLSNQSYQKACNYFKKYKPSKQTKREERALLYETLASLNCSGKRETYLKKASNEWEKEGVLWRASLLKDIAKDNYSLRFNTSEAEPNLEKINFTNTTKLTLGKTKIEITKQDTVITQVDRVYRDWLGGQMKQSPFRGDFLVTFSERLSYPEEELRSDIGWHEGARVKNIKDNLDITAIAVSGTFIARKDNRWYASDEKGIFQFEVPFDKVSYPTTRFFTNDTGMIIDSHGVNMLVEQAIRKNANTVLSDCDHENKVKAAIYLSSKGVDVVCFPDRFVYRALGHNARLVGSPIWRYDQANQKMIYGDAPLTLYKNQTIVVNDADIGKKYAIWYYTTPMLYFQQINKTFELNIIPGVIDDFNQTERVYDLAREHNAKVVATRVFNSYDYHQAKKWLAEDKEHKIILFHSTMYPYAIILMDEFSNQLSFDDPNPLYA